MTPESLAFLATSAGSELLHYASTLQNDRLIRLQTLRKRTTPEIAASAVSVLELRHRALAKFPDAASLFFTSEGLEQASSASIAQWRAAQFPPEIALLDACCGLGSDARAFAEARRIVAIDANPMAAVCAALNLRDRASARVACSDIACLDLPALAHGGIRAAFFDPSRRVTDKYGRRVRAASSDDYSPPLAFLHLLSAHFPHTAAKVSPAIADETLESLRVRVEFVSSRGECKEAVLWSEVFRRVPLPVFAPEPRYSATILKNDGAARTLMASGVPLPAASAPRRFLMEPDPAVIRAHLVAEVAEMCSAAPLDFELAYLTTDISIQTPFADTYAIIETCPFDKKAIQRTLRMLGGRLIAIKKRGINAEPETWRKQIKDTGDTPYLLFLTRCQGKGIALFCTISSTENSS